MARRRNIGRAGRKEQIKTLFQVRIEAGHKNAMTPYQIARCLEISASTHLNKILAEMCAEGILRARIVNKSGRWAGREFRLTKKHVVAPKKPRSIALNVRGQSVGQLELWS